MLEREADFLEMVEEKELEEKDESESRWGNFKSFSKKIAEIYRTDDSLALKTDHSNVSREIFRITNKALLKGRLQTAYEEPYIAADISKGLHSIDRNYAKIISYFANMFYVRYVVVPTQPMTDGDELPDEEYLRIYGEMIEVVDGLSLEVIVPSIIKETLLAGAAYLYGIKNTASRTISFIMLPTRYCRTILQTSFGTNLIEFNFQYFDQFRSQETLDAALAVFPKEFASMYNQVRGENDKWLPLDARYSTSFMLNDRALPPFLNALVSILDYEDFREKEKIKNDNELKAIFVNRVPVWENQPLFDLNEMKAIHAGLKRVLKQHDGLQPVTVFGESELIQLQKTGEKENKVIEQSYKTIYNSVGVNPAISVGETKEALDLMKSVDQGYIWDLIVNINNFINVAVNNLYKFKPLQAEISILPVTIARELELVKEYRENAAYGIGKLEAIVATGIKQKHIADRAKLERVLDLENLLKPLQSSHTQGSLNAVTAGANGDGDTNETDAANGEEETSQDEE